MFLDEIAYIEELQGDSGKNFYLGFTLAMKMLNKDSSEALKPMQELIRHNLKKNDSVKPKE